MTAIRKISLGLILLVGALLVEGYFNGPNPWILKYDLGGNPIATTDRETFVLWFSIFFILTNAIVLGVSRFVGKDVSLEKLNIPHKDYWSRAENAPEALIRIRALMDGILIFINFTVLISVAFTRFGFTGKSVNVLLAVVMVMSLALVFATFRLFKPR